MNRVLPLSLISLVAACSSSPPMTPAGPDAGEAAVPDAAAPADAMPRVADGTFEILIYNVAGLPGIISGGDPVNNTALMSPLLNKYDFAMVQEDFSYHDQLKADAEHPYQSEPMELQLETVLGDGLNRFSNFPFTEFERFKWEGCNGIFESDNDCLTTKGFSVATHEVAPGVFVDIYNLHMDSGHDKGDYDARTVQTEQLITEILKRSAGKAIWITGDTNMDEHEGDQVELAKILEKAQVVDACAELSCGEEDRVDRVFFRSSEAITFELKDWRIDLDFFDEDGEALSDHEAIGVTLDYFLN